MSKNLLNLLLLVSTVVLFYVVINPLYTGVGSVWQPEQGIVALRTTDSQYDDALNQAQSLMNEAKTLRSKYEGVPQDTKDKLKVMVPDRKDLDPVRMVSEVNTIANNSGVSLSDLSYSEGTGVGNKGAYTISFTAKTTYNKFKEIMRNYETSLRLYSIQSVVFAVPETDSSIIPFQVKMDTYYIK